MQKHTFSAHPLEHMRRIIRLQYRIAAAYNQRPCSLA